MAKKEKIKIDELFTQEKEEFISNIDSQMYFKSELSSNLMNFDWLQEIEFACPYIDNIIRNPKVALITEEDVVKIEKAKKITVASVKDLAKHTHFIDKVDPVTNEVQPSRILIARNEETYNTYENRFIYTLIDNLIRFMFNKEKIIEEFEVKKEKTLEYVASSNVGSQKVKIELKINSKKLLNDKNAEDFQQEIETIKLRVKKIKDYLSNWRRSEMIKSLEKMRVSFVTPPIKKTNVILKNANFQIAMKLWGYLQLYEIDDPDGIKDGLQTTGEDILKEMIDDSFLIDYLILDTVDSTKKDLREKLPQYAIFLLMQQIKRTISILSNYGITLDSEEILALIAKEMNNEQEKRLIGSSDVKDKFKNALDEYLERMQDYL